VIDGVANLRRKIKIDLSCHRFRADQLDEAKGTLDISPTIHSFV